MSYDSASAGSTERSGLTRTRLLYICSTTCQIAVRLWVCGSRAVESACRPTLSTPPETGVSWRDGDSFADVTPGAAFAARESVERAVAESPSAAARFITWRREYRPLNTPLSN